jgi:hypothetical protein
LGERVRATLRMLVAGPLSEEALEVTLAPWIVQLRPAVEEAHLAHESEQDTLSWSAQVEGLRAALRALREAAALDASAAPQTRGNN